MNNFCILLADNDADFLSICAEFLRSIGYQVLAVNSPAEAWHVLETMHIHLAVFDLRLADDKDQQDRSGLILAKNAAQFIPKIILTKFPTHQDVREALRANLEGVSPAIDFIDKHWGLDKLQIAVEQALMKYVRINWNLVIHWESALNFPYLVTLIEPTIDTIQLPMRSSELEDIFRKLFNDSFQITIGRLLLLEKGQIILEVFAYTAERGEDQFVVSCGQRLVIESEAQRYEKFIHKESSVGTVEKRNIAQTVHFAATTYSLGRGKLEEVTPFKLFYLHKPIEDIGAALDYLFNTTLTAWYAKSSYYEEINLSEYYQHWLVLNDDLLNPAELERRIEAICKATLLTGLAQLDYASQRLTYHWSNGASVSYPTPAAYLVTHGQVVRGTLVLCAVIHGNVDPDTILVDQAQRTWLINFTKTERGPLLSDFMALETAVKLDLFATADLQMCSEIEQRLLMANALDETINPEHLSAEFDKPLRTVGHIRQRAAAVAGSELTPYLVGLFFCAIARVVTFDPTVRYTKRELIPFAHGLLLAAMLSEKLTDWPQSLPQLPSAALDTLWLHESNREVWVEGRQAELTPQDFDILAYLYRNRGQVCSRQAIVENALGEVYKDESTETSRLNSAMSRLRQKIESDPEHPKYLITIRGYGYKLM